MTPTSFHIRRQSLLIALAFGVAVLLGFQNCSKGPGSSAKTQTVVLKDSGNGDGYGGKTTYEDPGNCADKGPLSKIEADGHGGYSLTRENCQDIAPQSVAVSDLMAHNTGYLTYKERLFQVRRDPGVLTTLLCRGDALTPTGLRNVMDGIIDTSGSAETASVKVGQYDQNGLLLQAYDAEQVAVTETAAPMGGRLITGFDDAGNRVFELRISFTNGLWRGNMAYAVRTAGQADGTPASQLIPVPGVICHEP
jgi:hypothetical protein